MTERDSNGLPPRLQRLGVRLMLLFLLLALVMTLTFMTGLQRALGGGWRALVRPLVADYVDRLATDIGSPPDIARAQALVARLPLAVRIEGPQVNWSSHPDGLPRHAIPPRLRHRTPWWRGDGVAADAPSGHPMHPMMRPDNDDDDPPAGERGWFTLTRLTTDGHRIVFGLGEVPLQHQPRVIGWVTLALLLLVTALAYVVVRHLLRPLAEIRAGAVRYGRGEFDTPIAVRRADELGQLAGQINTMAGELHHMLDAKRALLLAISHELRSPLTRARLNAELVEEGPSRDALLRDLAEMGTLISDLLESERLAAGHRALQTEPTDLGALIRQTVADLLAGRGIEPGRAAPEIECLMDDGVGTPSVDPMRWRLLVRNLVENALRHGRLPPAQAQVIVTLRSEGNSLCLSVRDHGPGVAAEHLAHLSEPFYRTDAARARHTGGVGLGLHLCHLVAQAHGGELSLRNAQPGLEVRVRWPRQRPEGGSAGAHRSR